MHAGTPLTDEDRWPWLRAIAHEIDAMRARGEPAVVACSALKRAYRDILIGDRTDVVLVYLQGSKALIAERIAARKGHFMPPALLDSQFATLEEPGEDEHPIVVSIAPPPDAIVDEVVRQTEGAHSMSGEFAVYPSLRDRVVFITGGASGIGAEHVTQFAAQGAKVAFVDIADDAAQALIDRIEAAGHPVPFYQHCDLKDIAALQATIAEVGRRLGPITVLVNNAANDQRHKFEDVTVEYWDERLATNLRHQFFAIQAVAPMMRAAGGGSIINFGSVSWHSLQGGMPAYTTAKAAVEGLTRGMARDLGPDRIRVNTVIPGWIMTERQITLWLTPEAEKNLMQVQCLKEKLAPADVTRMVLWLASDDSRMCTAQLWVVDAGRM